MERNFFSIFLVGMETDEEDERGFQSDGSVEGEVPMSTSSDEVEIQDGRCGGGSDDGEEADVDVDGSTDSPPEDDAVQDDSLGLALPDVVDHSRYERGRFC